MTDGTSDSSRPEDAEPAADSETELLRRLLEVLFDPEALELDNADVMAGAWR